MDVYKALLGGLVLLLGLVRARRTAASFGTRKVRTRSRGRENFLVALNFAGVLAVPLAYVFTGWLDGFRMGLPGWLRIAGALGYAAGLLLLWWTHRTIGRNWSMALEIRKGHRLVVNGPYRHVRHPMYLAFWLIVLSQWLVSSNWLVGLFGVSAWALLYFVRVPAEEAMMTEEFGDRYEEYAKRTGRVLPKWPQG